MAFRTLRDDYARHRGEGASFVALTVYRFGRWALERRSAVSRFVFSRLYRILNSYVKNVIKIDIPAEVVIGVEFHIIHGYAYITIHPDVVIGDRCGIMHGVTIGQNMFSGVATIGDDVFIGVGAAILGEVTIGDRARIGANAVVTTNVPADSIVQSPQSRVMPSLTAMAAKAKAERAEKDKAAKEG
jgi:serine O-acetyltransferase